MTIWTSQPSSAEVPERSGIHALTLAEGVDAFLTGARIDGAEDANLAHHVPHVPDRLAAARDRVADLTSTDAGSWHLMRQVHGARVGIVDDEVPPGAELRDVDVLVTSLTDRPLVVLAADCLPILAAGRSVIAVAHAGWRGIVAGVADALVDALCRSGEQADAIRVRIGPAIGSCCFAVGRDVHAAVTACEPSAAARTRDGRESLDLRAALRSQLHGRGVTDVSDVPDVLGADGVRDVCTACDPRWFSHRRDPSGGRHAGLVVRRGRASADGEADGGPA